VSQHRRRAALYPIQETPIIPRPFGTHPGNSGEEVSSLFVRLNLVQAIEERRPRKGYDLDLIRLLPRGAKLMAAYQGKESARG